MNFGGEADGATIGISHDRRCDRGERNAERHYLLLGVVPMERGRETLSRTKAN